MKTEPRIKELAMTRKTLDAFNKICNAIDGLPNKYKRRSLDAAAIISEVSTATKVSK